MLCTAPPAQGSDFVFLRIAPPAAGSGAEAPRTAPPAQGNGGSDLKTGPPGRGSGGCARAYPYSAQRLTYRIPRGTRDT